MSPIEPHVLLLHFPAIYIILKIPSEYSTKYKFDKLLNYIDFEIINMWLIDLKKKNTI